MRKFSKKQKIALIMCMLTIVFVGVIAVYAFAPSIANTLTKHTADLSMGTMALRFADRNNGIVAQLSLGEKVTKQFLIENTGSLEASLSLDWDVLVNTYLDTSLTYSLSCSETENGEYKKIVPETSIPTSDIPVSRPLASEISVPSGETYYYNLEITLNDRDFDQTPDIKAVFNTKFNVGAPQKYRNYVLSISPNGGEWKGFIGVQEYRLKNDESMIIENPQRTGYTFSGWDINGVSSEIDGTTFSMGISNTILKAKWTPNKYQMTIDRVSSYDTLEVEYGKTYDLGEVLEKEGHTFTGWSSTGGIIEDNSITITDDKDIAITPNFVINNYKYIVYHNKMNTDGNGYTLVDADTDEGEATFNTTIYPDIKTYTGFTSPMVKPMTIRAEIAYPPVKNRIDYNYDRYKYTLTVDTNGGTYEGSTIEELYYEQKKILPTPTKTGYNFTNWTVTGATINGSEIAMGLSNASATANYTPKTMSATFFANGGSFNENGKEVEATSKIVTYNEPIGTLPIPKRDGYLFQGYSLYVENGVSSSVGADTIVTETEDFILVANWVKVNQMMAVTSINYNEKLWAHKNDVTSIVFETELKPKENAKYTYDISAYQYGGVMCYLVTNNDDSTKYTAYIQAADEIVAHTYCTLFFAGFTNLQSIVGLENLNTSKTTNMAGMFSGSTSLTSIDLSSLDTSKVNDMSGMFSGCSSLSSINLSNIDTSQVTNMSFMFDGCSKLTSIVLNDLDTSQVVDMSYMFQNCRNLTTLDLSTFDTGNTTNMKGLFSGCNNITVIDMSNFNTSKVTDMNSMFGECKRLTSLDISSFDTSNVTDMSFMFAGSVKDGDHESSDLISIKGLEKFNTSNVTNMAAMFQNLDQINSLDLSGFNTSKVTDMSYMFAQCKALNSLNISNFNVSSVTTREFMFNYVPSDIKIKVGNTSLQQWSIDTSNGPKLTSANFVVG